MPTDKPRKPRRAPDHAYLSTSDQAELAALADGSLAGERRGEVQARIAESDELKALVDDQAFSVELTRDASAVGAPPNVRTAVRRLGTKKVARTWRVGLVTAAATAAVIVAVITAISLPGDRSEPSFLRATALSSRAATMPAPGKDPTRPAFLRQAVGGVAYPNWARDYGLPAVGQRQDDLAGRRAVTVFYAGRSGDQLGYTIVAGRPLTVPPPATTVVREGVTINIVREAGRRVVTWQRGGHTCILVAGLRTSVARLVELAGSSAERS